MTWLPADPGQPVEERHRLVPFIFWPRLFEWMPFVSRMDTLASYPTTLDLLAALVTVTEPRTLVEAGTYRGHSAFAMAEVLYLNKADAHLWTADTTDFHVTEVFEAMHLTPWATFYKGDFGDMLNDVPGQIDFAYIDASSKEDANLRTYFLDLVLSRMSSGGLVVVDDAGSDEPVGVELRRRANLYLPWHHGVAIFRA